MRFLGMAKLTSLWSKDPSTKVGCVIVKPDLNTVTTGFNGFPRNVPDEAVWYADPDMKRRLVKHAEENAFNSTREDLTGCTLYVYPLPPCSLCAGDIVARGITRVVAFVPPSKRHRLEDPNYRFDLTEMILHKNDVRYDVVFLEDEFPMEKVFE